MRVVAREHAMPVAPPPMPLLDPVVAETRLAFALVECRVGLAALEADWTALFEHCGLPQQVFQTFAWLAAWSRHYLRHGARLAIVTGRLGDRTVVIWPMVIQVRLGLRILTFMGEPVSQYGDALLDPALAEADLDAAFDFVMALPFDVLSLRRVRDDAALAPLLRRRLPPPANIQHAPFIDFAGARNPEAFERRYNGKLRSSRRRHLRRLEDIGPVRFAHFGPSPEAMALIPVALGFKRDWARRNAALATPVADPRFERFFVDCASGAPGSPGLRVSAVYCAEAIAGVEISVACKGRLFGHVLAPNPAFEKPGIGGILAGRSIISALEQGYTVYDTLAPADPYKREWTESVIALGDYTASRGVRGALYTRVWLNFGRQAVKTAVKSLRGPLKRWSASRGRPSAPD